MSNADETNHRLDLVTGSGIVEPPFPLYAAHGNNAVNKKDESPSPAPTFEEGWNSVVRLLRKSKRIIVLTGAGMSVSCGIPDFRSRGTGLYETLDAEELGLSCPEELFDLEVFESNPQPFYMFARNLYFPLGTAERVRPSDSHKLLGLLEQRNMLARVYTQNIDGLEQQGGVSAKKVVYCHGSLQWATCCRCKRKVDASDIESDILNGTVARCRAPCRGASISNPRSQPSVAASALPSTQAGSTRQRSTRTAASRKRPRDHSTTTESLFTLPPVCGGVMKPGVTFFGETLHDNVRKTLECDRTKVDALIVIGTSLSVAPVSKVIDYLPSDIPRILINRTIVHPASTGEDQPEDEGDSDIGTDLRRGDYVFDAYLLGFCDDVTRALARDLFRDSPAASNQCNNLEATGRLLASLNPDDAHYNIEDWKSTTVPSDRIFLFPGALPPNTNPFCDGSSSALTYREIAHCDGCSQRITAGTIHKCIDCFDYDLCDSCFPVLFKNHHDGKHQFAEEAAAMTSAVTTSAEECRLG